MPSFCLSGRVFALTSTAAESITQRQAYFIIASSTRLSWVNYGMSNHKHMSEQKTHLGIYGVILNDNNILLIKKSRGPYKGKLDLPGGKLEHGEALLDGLAREIKEETGLIAKSFKLYDNYSIIVDFNDAEKEISMYHVGLLYVVTVASIDDIKETTDEEDSLGAAWHPIATLDSEQLSPFAKMAVKGARYEAER